MACCWDVINKPAVFCGILHVETTTIRWAMGLRALQFPGPHHIGLYTGLPFDHARNRAVQDMLSNPDFDYLFFLDSDVVPPHDAIPRLLKHRLPIVSGVYCRRSYPHGLVVAQKNGDWVRKLPGKGKDPLVEVDVVGAGCLLVHRSVFETVPPQRPAKPWFDWRADMVGMEGVPPPLSEDFTWCVHVRQHGHHIMLDTSVRCLHIGHAQADLNSLEPLLT